MGILVNALVIVIFSLFGGKLQKYVTQKSYWILGISIMIISLVGFLENIFTVSDDSITSGSLTVIIIAFIIGTTVGDILHLDDKFSNISMSENKNLNAVMDAFFFFGIGGLQICGPVELAVFGDNTQLFINSIIDVPFAIVFGATYGKVVSLSSIPVALMQIVIAVIAYFLNGILSDQMVAQMCSMGYIILFFTGFNLMTNGKYKISNLSMLPGILIVILFNLISGLWG